VAGLYRTFDSGVPLEMAGKPVQVRLVEKPGEEAGRLIVEALQTDLATLRGRTLAGKH
jgi:hypothetical protein